MEKMKEHENFDKLMERDGFLTDLKRVSLFWILAGNEDLYKNAAAIYNFEDHSINPDILESDKVDLCGSSRALIRLGFNLFNGFPADVMETFRNLDEKNYILAMGAINIRLKV